MRVGGRCIYGVTVFSHTHLIPLCILFPLQVMNHGLEEIGIE